MLVIPNIIQPHFGGYTDLCIKHYLKPSVWRDFLSQVCGSVTVEAAPDNFSAWLCQCYLISWDFFFLMGG